MVSIRFIKTIFTDKYQNGNGGQHNKYKAEKEMLGFKKIIVFCKESIRSLKHLNGTKTFGFSQERQLRVSLTKLFLVSSGWLFEKINNNCID